MYQPLIYRRESYAKTFRRSRFGDEVFVVVTFATATIETTANANAISWFLECSTKQVVATPILRSKQGGPTLELDGHRSFLALVGWCDDGGGFAIAVDIFQLAAVAVAVAGPPGFVNLAGYVFDLRADSFPVGHFVPPILLGVPVQIPANIIGGLGIAPAFLETLPKYFAGHLFGSFHYRIVFVVVVFVSIAVAVAVVAIVFVVRLGNDHGPELYVPRVGCVGIPLSKQDIDWLRALHNRCV